LRLNVQSCLHHQAIRNNVIINQISKDHQRLPNEHIKHHEECYGRMRRASAAARRPGGCPLMAVAQSRQASRGWRTGDESDWGRAYQARNRRGRQKHQVKAHPHQKHVGPREAINDNQQQSNESWRTRNCVKLSEEAACRASHHLACASENTGNLR